MDCLLGRLENILTSKKKEIGLCVTETCREVAPTLIFYRELGLAKQPLFCFVLFGLCSSEPLDLNSFA